MVPTVDRAKATVMTKVQFDAIDPRILPDMSAKVSFLSQEVTADAAAAAARRAVPMRSPRAAPARCCSSCATARRSRCRSRAGRAIGDLVAITGDVRSGEKAVLKPAADLASGTLVKVAPEIARMPRHCR